MFPRAGAKAGYGIMARGNARHGEETTTVTATGTLRVVPLGGVGEIGKNMIALCYEGDILIIDAGLAFPEEEMLGIDVVIPDITFLKEGSGKVVGVVLTHGHEDHIGALPYLLHDLDAPVFGTPLTLGLAEAKVREKGESGSVDFRPVRPGQRVEIGCFQVEFFRVNHAVPDTVGLAIHSPAGIVVHSGDFKFDQTPVDGQVTDYHKLAELGRSEVLLLLSDSTNAERPGYTPSERVVGETLYEIMRTKRGRILVASFASNVHRIQQVLDAACSLGRKVCVVGRSMQDTVAIAMQLGYLHAPPDLIVSVEEACRLPAAQCVVLCTGSQGEPLSALARMSVGEHRAISLAPGDVVIIAATPVPGNEKLVHRTIDNLFRRGAEVIYGPESGVHVSGHGSREELKMMINLVRPRYFIPIHGEYRHLVHHAALAREVGLGEGQVLFGENGTVFAFSQGHGRIAGRVPSGQVLVDGLGVGDVGSVVLRDRHQLARDGILVAVLAARASTGELVAGPDLISRGFVYMRQSEELLTEAARAVLEVLKREELDLRDWSAVKSVVREVLGRFVYERTRRRPMILPIIVEV